MAPSPTPKEFSPVGEQRILDQAQSSTGSLALHKANEARARRHIQKRKFCHSCPRVNLPMTKVDKKKTKTFMQQEEGLETQRHKVPARFQRKVFNIGAATNGTDKKIKGQAWRHQSKNSVSASVHAEKATTVVQQLEVCSGNSVDVTSSTFKPQITEYSKPLNINDSVVGDYNSGGTVDSERKEAAAVVIAERKRPRKQQRKVQVDKTAKTRSHSEAAGHTCTKSRKTHKQRNYSSKNESLEVTLSRIFDDDWKDIPCDCCVKCLFS